MQTYIEYKANYNKNANASNLKEGHYLYVLQS